MIVSKGKMLHHQFQGKQRLAEGRHAARHQAGELLELLATREPDRAGPELPAQSPGVQAPGRAEHQHDEPFVDLEHQRLAAHLDRLPAHPGTVLGGRGGLVPEVAVGAATTLEELEDATGQLGWFGVWFVHRGHREAGRGGRTS